MDPILYKIVRPLIKGFMYIFFRPTIIGKENIPKKGRVLLAGNHTHFLDCLLLISTTKRCIHFLAKDSLYKGIKKVIFKNMGIIPVNRKIHDKSAIIKGNEVLNNDGVVAVFPEGTINRTNDIIMPFKYGAIKMASETNSYLVPFTITGKFKLFRKSMVIKFEKPYIVKKDNLTSENNKLMKIVKESLIKSKVEK